VADKRKRQGSPAVALRLSPERAFVLHLDARAEPSRRLLGRIEHVRSGRVARITSLRSLMRFLTDVLADVDVRGSPPRPRGPDGSSCS